jgi:hypothetical protein
MAPTRSKRTAAGVMLSCCSFCSPLEPWERMLTLLLLPCQAWQRMTAQHFRAFVSSCLQAWWVHHISGRGYS